jgi:hypothetical protein
MKTISLQLPKKLGQVCRDEVKMEKSAIGKAV